MSESASVSGNDPTPIGSSSGSTPTAGGGTGTQAPAASSKPSTSDQYRDALKRVNAGEDPKAVNQAVFQQPAKAAATTPAKSTPATQTTTSDAAPATGKNDGEQRQPAAADLNAKGLTAQEQQAFKRAKLNLADSHWSHTPPSTLKAMAKDLMKSQSEADRAYQQQQAAAKAGGSAKPGEQASGTAAAASQGQANADPAAGEVAGGETGDAGAGNASDQPTGQESSNLETSGNIANFFAPMPPMDAETRSTLEALGGEPLVKSVEQRDAALHKHFQQQVAPLMQGFQAVAGMLEEQHAREGLEALAKSDPAYANLTDDQTKTVRAKATQLLRASDAPISSYSMRDAIGDAARLVLSTNVKQAAQTQLLNQRAQSLNGSPDKGTSRTTPTGKPLTQAQLTRAVHQLMQQGKTAAEARQMVDAGQVPA